MQKKNLSKKFGTALVALIAVTAVFAMVSLSFEGAYATTTPGQNTVAFKESGLATGTSWNVIFNGKEQASTTAYDNFTVTANGSYDFSLVNPNSYSGTPTSGVVAVTSYNVAGATNITEPITFKSTAKTYEVSFYTNTLAAGEIWSVALNGVTSSSNTNTVAFYEPNGSYSFNIPDVGHWYANPFSGTITVSGNSNLPKWMNGILQTNVTFNFGYTVTFSASNLPSYVPWSVTFNGTTNSTTGNHNYITFSIRNGTGYNYSVSIAPNWKASPITGKLNVSGAAVSQTITFTELYFKIIFVETNLPSGTAWTVNVNGVPYVTTNGTFTLSEHNGSLAWSVPSIPGYTANVSSGTVALQYSNVVVHVNYSPGTTVKSSTGNGSGFLTLTGFSGFFLHSTYGYIVDGLIVIALIALLAVGAFKAGHTEHRKKGRNYKK